MRKRAILIVGVALLIAAAGVVYAHWTETLYVDATVQSGTMTMAWTNAFTDDDGVYNVGFDNEGAGGVPAPIYRYSADGSSSRDPSSAGPMATRYDKDVADCVSSISTDGYTYSVIARNVFPSYHCTMWATHTNTATVPMKAQELHINWLSGPTGGAIVLDPTQFASAGDWDNLAGHACGQQVDPGQSYTVINTFHVLQGAMENYTYQVTQEIDFVNWNEWSAANCNVYYNGVLVHSGSPW